MFYSGSLVSRLVVIVTIALTNTKDLKTYLGLRQHFWVHDGYYLANLKFVVMLLHDRSKHERIDRAVPEI